MPFLQPYTLKLNHLVTQLLLMIFLFFFIVVTVASNFNILISVCKQFYVTSLSELENDQ